jgi:hypothetical protein
MEAIEASNEARRSNSIRSLLRTLAAGVALAALFLTGFVTEANAQSGASTIVVRARGTAGGESISLRVGNSNVATWTLTTSFQTFSASTTLAGTVTVAFTNDGGSRDVQVDYIIVNGETRQSENQSSNTGLYANGSCGGGRTANGCIATAPSPMAPSPIRPTASWCVRAARRARSPSACASTTQCRDLDDDDEPAELQRVDEPHRQHHGGLHQ